jgi:hypothetical protein
MCFARVLTAFGQEGKVFQHLCSTGEFLLDFLKVIITANLFSYSLTDC